VSRRLLGSVGRLGRVGWLAVLATAGCEQILSLHERSEATDGGVSDLAVAAGGEQADARAPGTGHCGPLLYTSMSCAACMDKSCCSEAKACANDPACHEASECLASCAETDATCRARCAEFYTLPETLMALRSCRLGPCAAACSSSCGEFASPIPGCQTCQEATCCAQSTSCATNTSCADLDLCVSNCFGTASCPNDCQTQYAQGVKNYTASLACTNQCASQCAAGQAWSCLDTPVAWPKPNAVGNVAFAVTFVTFTSEAPFVGAMVKACGKFDIPCLSPIDAAQTDATGRVTVHVPAGLLGFDGYLDITGGSVSGTGAAVFPTIWYPIPYVIADGWRGRTQILSSDEFLELSAATATTPDPARGNIAMNAADCAFTPAAGVRFAVDSSDSATVSYYLVGGLPTTTATATDSSGVAAFVNLPTTATGRLTLVSASATSGPAQGKTLGSLSFIVRPGTLTTSGLFPPVPH